MKRIAIGCTIALLIPTTLLATFLLRRPTHGDNADRLESAPTIIAHAVEDWFLIHHRLPQYDDIKPAIDRSPREWQPRPNWQVTYRPTDQTVPDEEYGGQLTLLEVEITDQGHLLTQEKIPIDLRDPARLWKPRRTSLGPKATDYSLWKTDKNVTDAVAEAVWNSFKNKQPVEKTDLGIELNRNDLLRTYTWIIAKEKIVVTNSKTGDRATYPVAGPASVNENVPPLKLSAAPKPPRS